MITREEILSIEEYCAEHNVSHKDRLEELGISPWSYYAAKRKYREEDDKSGDATGQFVQLSSGRFVPQAMPPARTSGKAGKQPKLAESNAESYLTIELQTRTGTAMRIQGVMTPAHLRELITAGNV